MLFCHMRDQAIGIVDVLFFFGIAIFDFPFDSRWQWPFIIGKRLIHMLLSVSRRLTTPLPSTIVHYRVRGVSRTHIRTRILDQIFLRSMGAGTTVPFTLRRRPFKQEYELDRRTCQLNSSANLRIHVDYTSDYSISHICMAINDNYHDVRLWQPGALVLTSRSEGKFLILSYSSKFSKCENCAATENVQFDQLMFSIDG